MKTKMNDLWIKLNINAIKAFSKVCRVTYKDVTYDPERKQYVITLF